MLHRNWRRCFLFGFGLGRTKQAYIWLVRRLQFFSSSISILQTLVTAIGAGLGVWGVINLLEGYGNDNPGAKSQGIKQLMAGGGVILIGTQLVPQLSNLFGWFGKERYDPCSTRYSRQSKNGCVLFWRIWLMSTLRRCSQMLMRKQGRSLRRLDRHRKGGTAVFTVWYRTFRILWYCPLRA